MDRYPLVIHGEKIITDDVQNILSPWAGKPIAECCFGNEQHVSDALDSAEKGFQAVKKLRNYQRAEILHRMADLVKENAERIAVMIASEGGKPIAEARGEASRTEITFRLAAEAARSWGGELLPLDVNAAGGDRVALVRRFPRGVVTGISPFNFPANLVAHKIAPAIAVGCSINIKPASSTPCTAVILAQLLLEAGLPAGGCNVLPLSSKYAAPLVEDSRVRVLTFTGSAEVGWGLKRRAWDKQVCLELGGNAAAIIEPDCDLNRAVNRTVVGGYAHSGQVCISVQNVLVNEEIYDRFMEKYITAVAKLKVGDPLDASSKVAALIDESEAVRVEEWINEAIERGATLHCGGAREGAVVTPAVLSNVPDDCRISCDEVFGPVTIVSRYGKLDDALERVNSWKYGLQSGIFTHDYRKAFKAYNQLDVGGVVIDDVPTLRVDNFPYGGVKQSGFGREGVKYAMEEMTELKTMVISAER